MCYIIYDLFLFLLLIEYQSEFYDTEDANILQEILELGLPVQYVQSHLIYYFDNLVVLLSQEQDEIILWVI